jgi:spore germination protein YaaH
VADPPPDHGSLMLEQRTTVRRRVLGALAATTAAVTLGVLVPVSSDAATAPTPRRIVSGWGYFGSTSSSAMTSLAANADLFTDVSPFWYTATWSGTSSAVRPASYAANRATVLPALRATGVKVLPTITDGMPWRRMAAVMANATTRARFVAQIVAVVTANGYDGIDLDFEGFAFNDGSSTWTSTRPAWVAFVSALASALHARHRLLSVTVPAGTATSSDSTGYWVYAWSSIGRVADRVRIMAYDYSPSRPGPIAPFPWVERVVAHAVTQVPAGKISIGVPTYGRDWLSSVSGTCPELAPAGATSAQSTGFFGNLSWAKGRHAFGSSSAAGFVKGLFVDAAATVPGISVAKAPVISWDATNKERTYPYQVRFTGRHQLPAVTAAAVGGLAGTTQITVAPVTGVTPHATVSGTGIAAGATVVSITGDVVTLSAPNTGNVTGALTFTSTVSTTGTAVLSAPTTLTVADPTGITVGATVAGTGIPAGTTVKAVSGSDVTLSAPVTAAITGSTVAFTTKLLASAPGGVAGRTSVLLASTTGVSVGAAVTGAGVGSGAKVTSISGHTVTLSVPNAKSVTGTLRITPAPVAQACVVSRVGWYSDGSSAVARAGLVGKYHLLGIAEWTIGGEDLAQWGGLRAYARTIAPVATSASLTAPTRLYVGRTGALRAVAATASGRRVGVRVAFSWRRAGSTAWTPVGSAVTNAQGVASLVPRAVTTSGWWRVDVPGTWSILPKSVVAAPTTVVRAPSQLTLSATARVLAGRPAAALARLGSLGHPVAGAPVVFLWQRAGTRTWARIGAVRTGATGLARLAYRPATSGYVRAVFGGTSALLPAATATPLRTALLPVVAPSSTSLRVRHGLAAWIRATVAPAGASHPVVVQRRVGTRWVRVATVAGNSLGRVAYAVPTRYAGTQVYRFVVPRSVLFESAVSAAVVVRVV